MELDNFLTPKLAILWLKEHRQIDISVDSLRQLRRRGRIGGRPIGDQEKSRMTLYRIADLAVADIEKRTAGRPEDPNSARYKKRHKIGPQNT